jgi:hypothetical protein
MRRSRSQSGFALLMVLTVVAFTSVMGMAMLWSSSLRAQTGAAATDAAIADYNAESAINLALYWLRNPGTGPDGFDEAMATGEEWQDLNLTLPSPAIGSAELRVVRVEDSAGMYDVTAVGKPSSSTGTSRLTRTLTTRVRLKLEPYSMTDAAHFNGGITINTRVTINGNVKASGPITYAGSGANKGKVNGTASVVASPPGPTGAELLVYNDTYWYGDPPKQYKVGRINSNVELHLAGPSSSNPAGIYRYTGDSNSTLALTGLVSFNGTLIVPGRLYISGQGNTITARSGYPALIVGRNIHIDGNNRQLVVNGMVWCADGITASSSSASSAIYINGALVIDSPSFGNNSTNRTVNVSYDPSKLSLVEFAPGRQTVSGIEMLQWSQLSSDVEYSGK